MDKIVKVTSNTPWDAKFVRATGYHGVNKDIVTVEYYRTELMSSRLDNVAPSASIMEAAKYIEMTKIDKPVSEPKANPINKDPTLASARDKNRTDLPRGRNVPTPEQKAIDIWTAAAKNADKFPYLSLFNKKQDENLPKRAKVPVGKVVGSQKELKKKVTAEAISPSAGNVWTLQTIVQSSPTLSQDQQKQQMLNSKIDELAYDSQRLTRDQIRELLTMCGMSPQEIQDLESNIYSKPAPRLKESWLDEALRDEGIDNLDAEAAPKASQDQAQSSADPVMDATLDNTAQVPEPKTGQSLAQIAGHLKQLSAQSKRQFLELEVNQQLKVLQAGSTGQIAVKTLKIQSIIPVAPDGFQIVAKDSANQEVKFAASLADLRQHKVTNGYYCIKRSKG